MAVKASKGTIRASPFLTKLEKANKSNVYRQAKRYGWHVTDMGDMVQVSGQNGKGQQPD